jgi:WD repeat and SOF domain-containing protein 1
LLTVKYNPSETGLLACSSTDCSIHLYDVKGGTPVRKTYMKLKSNSISWNPREPMSLTTANDDGHLYTFDIRKFNEVLKIHKDHTNSVMSVAYSPIGREFVSGATDRTIRIFDVKAARSREVYHTRRMHNILAVEFSGDGKFVISGSDDANLRIWKARAAEPLKTLLPREQQALRYANKLKAEYKHTPEVGRILRHRHLPKFIYNAKKRNQVRNESDFQKQENIKEHTRRGKFRQRPARQKPVVESVS